MPIIPILSDKIAQAYRQAGRPFFVALCGWADLGKSTLAEKLATELREQDFHADWLSTDAFLKDRNVRYELGVSGYHPQSIDTAALQSSMQALRNGTALEYYPYDNKTGKKLATSKRLVPQDVVILEGIHAFHPCISEDVDLKIFIDSDEDTLKKMRYRGNLLKRGMECAIAGEKIEDEFKEYKQYVLHHKHLADVVVHVDVDFNYCLET